ncbi:MAG TPA: hypothetical protein VEG63_06250 [Candidatus Acidoferrales bacterium]|nr:hypothetical protein [Candidatus Acidoferrales bacterium]
MSAADAAAGRFSADPSVVHPAVNPWLIAITVTLATFMEVLDTSIAKSHCHTSPSA